MSSELEIYKEKNLKKLNMLMKKGQNFGMQES